MKSASYRDYISITVNINENYLPLIDMIDQIAIEQDKSRSSVMRDIACEHFGFKPAKIANKYGSMKNLLAELA